LPRAFPAWGFVFGYIRRNRNEGTAFLATGWLFSLSSLIFVHEIVFCSLWEDNFTKCRIRNFIQKNGRGGHKRLDPKTAEFKAMEKKVKDLEAANDILKKALAFFAGSQKK